MIVTIDGPAGAGKSTTAKALAQRLGFRFLDTGAMYRTVALAALRQNVNLADVAALVETARSISIRLIDDRVFLGDEDVSAAIRTQEITAVTHFAANNSGVRAVLVEQQKFAGREGNIVTEGRDQGTVVFPQAECKFFLTASQEERARRRQAELEARGEESSLSDVLAAQNSRDRSDQTRQVGPLVAADDALEVITDGMSREEVVAHLETLVRKRIAGIRGD
jgi:cytidylate kinase